MPAGHISTRLGTSPLPAGKAGYGQFNAELLRGAYDADINRVATALEDGADVNAADQDTGLTALHIAVGMNNLALTQLLVEDYEASFGPDKRGRWPSVIAAQCRVGVAMCDYIVAREAGWLERQKTVSK